MRNPILALVACLRRFWERREGGTALMFGLCFIPVVIASGMAVDATRAYTVKVRLGAALDASALAIGSTLNETSTQLNTRLGNYFAANYPPQAIGAASASAAVVPSGTDLNTTPLTLQATATVPMTFMELVGISSITVSATNQIHRTTGLEVAIALDNTGSMLCGPHSGAPAYNDTNCVQNVTTSDINCQQSSTTNQARICVLQQAATNFVNTLHQAMSSTNQLYVSIIPYVTTVNIGTSFCTGATTCTNMVQDCANNFVDPRGNTIYDTGLTALQPSPATTTLTVTGTTTINSVTISSVSSTTGLFPGQSVSGTGIPSSAKVASVVNSTSFTISSKATSTGTARTLTISYSGYYVQFTAGSASATVFPNATGLTAGMPMSLQQSLGYFTNGALPDGSGLISTSFSAVSGSTITLCTALNGAPAISGTSPVSFYSTGVPYDTTHSATTANWMGCVVEPTSADENTTVAGVQVTGTADPDFTEPASWPKWYAYWWIRNGGSTDGWTPSTIKAQTNATTSEQLGKVTSDFATFLGPNQGCPQPIIPLLDMSNSTNLNQVLLELGNIAGGTADATSIWPRDAGGTQVHIGAIWAWRTLSPNGPFAPSGGHPLAYSTASTTGWKKVMVLMTDGEEEWPLTNQLTGLSYMQDGKIGTTSNTTTATNNLSTRLASVCTNMAADGIIIYTIGLGTDGSEGANNPQLQSCPANTGYFIKADPTTLNAAFNQIASSLLALRLSQ